MRKYYSIISMLVLLLLGSCSKEQEFANGEGAVSFGLKAGSEDIIIRGTKAAPAVTYLLEVTNSKNELVAKIDDLSESNSTVRLLAKNYMAKIVGGKMTASAFDSPYYVGEKEFTVSANKTTNVDVMLKLGNIKVTVEYTPDLAQYLQGAETLVALSGGGSLTFNMDETRAGYFEPKAEQNVINWSLTLFPINGAEQPLSGTIDEKLTANDHLILRFGIKEGTSATGGLRVGDIVVDQKVEEAVKNLNITFPRFPEVVLEDGEINDEQNVTKSSITNDGVSLTVDIKAFPKIRSLKMTHSMQIGNKEEIDIIQNGKLADPLVLGDYNTAFIKITAYPEAPEIEDKDSVKVVLGNDFLKTLPILDENAGSYTFAYTVIDEKDRVIKRTLSFRIIDADVVTDMPKGNAIWATKIDMTGRWENAVAPTKVSFEYREASTTTWNSIDATKNNETKTFTATIKNLKPQTQYQIRAKGDNGGNVVKVTTLEAVQLYNSAFEIWSKEGSAYYLRENSSFAFWDSGNKGATTIGSNNPTEPEDNDIISGRAIRLTSKVIANNFAAGNLFAGNFIGVDILGGAIPEMTFGRQFISRPYSLKGYYKYNAETINYAGGGKDAFKGRPDRFSMAVILTDAANMPRYLKEKNKSPFDIDAIDKTGTDGNIRAIASAFFTNENIQNGVDNTTLLKMNSYAPFEMVLKYHEANKNLEVKYVVVIFSASKYGDFFTGGQGSCLLLDEIELDYKFK